MEPSAGKSEKKSIHCENKRLCYRKWLMLFSLKLQRDNRKNALSVAPAKGKTGKKAVFYRTVEMKQLYITEPNILLMEAVNKL